VVTAPATLRAPTGSPLALIVSAADPDADPIASLTANLASLPAGHGATFTPAGDAKSGVLAWTPAPGDTGQYQLAFTATNALVGSAATMLTVTPPNLPPTAALAVSPQTGNASLNVSANASGSSDPGGGALTYRFDFGDGFVVGPQASPIATHRYGPGQWTLLVSVTDLDGAVSTASTRVTVAATGPGLNLVGNPSFQWNTDRWRRFSATSIGRIAGGFDGNRSLRVAGPANLSTFGIDDSTNWVANTPAIGTHYRFGAWVRSTTAKGSARLQVREFLAGVPIDAGVVSAPLPLTPEWQLVTMELVTRASGSTIDFQVVDEPQAPGEVFDVDNISIHVLPEPASQTPMTTNDPPGGTQNHHGQLGGAPGAPPASAPGAPTDSKPWAPTGATAAPTVPDRFSVSVTPAMAGRGGTLRFATTVAGPVRVELYDLSGRRVRRLLDDPFMAPGLRELTLDGRGDQGERLDSGVYFYRVQAIERSATGRFVLVR
jgi:hypothetical protein